VADPSASARLASLALCAAFYNFGSYDTSLKGYLRNIHFASAHFARAALALRLAHCRAHASQNVLAVTSGLAALLVLLARLLGAAFDYFDLAALDVLAALDDLATMHFPRAAL
jgi:hypothetical protein